MATGEASHSPQLRTDDDLVDVAAGEHAQRALVQVHDGQVRAAPLPHVLVAVQPHEQEVPRRPRRLLRHFSFGNDTVTVDLLISDLTVGEVRKNKAFRPPHTTRASASLTTICRLLHSVLKYNKPLYFLS